MRLKACTPNQNQNQNQLVSRGGVILVYRYVLDEYFSVPILSLPHQQWGELVVETAVLSLIMVAVALIQSVGYNIIVN